MALHWHIVGNGAIGSLFAAKLQQNGIPVSTYTRSASSPITVTFTDNTQTTLTPAHSSPHILSCHDMLVLPVKVYQVANAIADWQPYLAADTPIMLLHNGMGGIEQVRKLCPTQPVIAATTTHGALKTQQTVTHTGKGDITLGFADKITVNSECQKLLRCDLEAAFKPIHWLENINEALWKKLIVNAAINPLTAIHQCQNGELREPKFRAQISRVVDEVISVAKACGIPVNDASTLNHVYDVITATAANYSSMNRDIANKRTTEIDGITGYIIERAKEKGIDVPTNTLLYHQIKQCEKAYTA